jgi:YlmC/YmxH family sporulation protein
MIRTSDLAEKDVITLKEGRNLGPISDIEVNLEEGRVEALLIPGTNRFLSFFGRENDLMIPWKDIVNIGIDVVLVEFRETIEMEKE